MKTLFLSLMLAAEPELSPADKLRMAQLLVEALATKIEADTAAQRHRDAGQAYETELKAVLAKIGKPGCALGRAQEVICPPKEEPKK